MTDPLDQALQHTIGFCEQVARDGILPSVEWFKEQAALLRVLLTQQQALQEKFEREYRANEAAVNRINELEAALARLRQQEQER